MRIFKVVQVPRLIAKSLIEMKGVYTGRGGRSLGGPGPLQVLRLLMRRVEQGGLLEVALGRVGVPLVLPHVKGLLSDPPVLVLSARLQIGHHSLVYGLICGVSQIRVMLAWVVAAVSHLKCHAGVLQFGESQVCFVFRFRGLSDLRREDALLGVDADPTLAAGRADGLAMKISLEACR